MVISVAARAAAKILLRKKQLAAGGKKWREANPEKVRLSNKISNQRLRAKNAAKKKAAKPTMKKTDYFIRKSPLPTTPGSVFTHGDWVHEMPVKKLRHVRYGTAAPPMRAFSPKQDIHKTDYFPKVSVKPVNENYYGQLRARGSDWFGRTKYVGSSFIYGPGPSGVPKKILEARKLKEKVKKSWWTIFLKQSREGKHIGVAGAVGGLGVYAASEGGKK